MKHQLIGGQLDGKIVEALCPASELVFPRMVECAAISPATDHGLTADNNHLRYTRREVPHNGGRFAVYACSDLSDQQVAKLVGL